MDRRPGAAGRAVSDRGPRAGRPDTPVLAVAVCGLLAAAVLPAWRGDWSSVALLGVAAAFGWVFHATSFGYAAAFRAWLTRGDGSGLAAGLLVAGVAALVIVPVSTLANGFGGYVAPLGPSVVVGAALFGLGMQLGNGCASGALYAAGGGSRRMWVVLPFFCAGGLLGSFVLPAALDLPSLPPVGLGTVLGPWGGLAATLALAGGLAGLLLRGGPRPSRAQVRAAVAIGALAALAFLLSGYPWGVTSGLTLWGAKAASALGFDLAWSTYWSWDGPRQELAGSVFAQPSSLMDIGMILGATSSASWRGRFRGQAWPSMRGLAGAALGGLLMGIGARLAFGCNIGAMVGGISSGSLHGFLWFFAALPGCWLGIRLRPWFAEGGRAAAVVVASRSG
jgi:uncharacterized membrane protein YedE/YeeE